MADIEFTRFESMTNVELRAELKRRGYPVSGNKKDLLAKLRNALQIEDEQNTSLNHSVGYTQNETLPVNDQHSSVDNVSITEDVYPMISIPRQLPESTAIDISEEKKPRTHSKKLSVDSRTNEISDNNEQIVLDNSNNIEVNSFVSKSKEEVKEEEEKNVEKIGDEVDLTSVGSSENAKSESIVKEIPLSDEQQRLNQSETINEEQNSAINISNDDNKNQNEVIDQSSKSADIPSIPTKQPENTKEEESEKVPQPKPFRSQTSSSIKIPTRSTNNKINLSSELLRTLIPDLSLTSESIINDELDNESIVDHDFLPSDSITIGELADQKQQTNRTVAIDDPNTRKKMPTRLPSFEPKDGQNNIMTDDPVRIKDVTIAHEPASQILYIRGLTRPFSLMQLKGLLSRYGTLIDGEFWLDKIKSQCLVTYNTLEEAQNARETLDGCRWPSTNPKTLSVRFGRQDELEYSKTQDLPPDHISTEKHSEDRIVEEGKSTSPINEIELKLQKEKYSGFLIIEEEEPVKTNEQSSKGLDDYFRKTKAKPCIYWLPLTEEQIIERIHRQEQRKVERDEERRKREIDENIRRSSEKRKRSSSPSIRNTKRH